MSLRKVRRVKAEDLHSGCSHVLIPSVGGEYTADVEEEMAYRQGSNPFAALKAFVTDLSRAWEDRWADEFVVATTT